MPFEVITPGGTPKAPADPIQPTPAPAAPAATSNAVSQEEAIKGGEHAKMNVFSVTDLSGGSGQSGASGGAPRPGSSVALGGLVQGKVAVDLMDALLPALLVLAFHKAGVSIKKSDMQLTVGEKNTLSPVVEACLNTINMDFSNPWSALGMSLAIIYGGKAIEKGGIAWLEKKAAPEPEKAPYKGGPAPVVGMTPSGTRAPAPSPIPDSKNTDTFVDPVANAGLMPFTEEHVKIVNKKRKRGPQDAREWLAKNWVKVGGVV
jgi:hypothetical protein